MWWFNVVGSLGTGTVPRYLVPRYRYRTRYRYLPKIGTGNRRYPVRYRYLPIGTYGTGTGTYGTVTYLDVFRHKVLNVRNSEGLAEIPVQLDQIHQELFYHWIQHLPQVNFILTFGNILNYEQIRYLVPYGTVGRYLRQVPGVCTYTYRYRTGFRTGSGTKVGRYLGTGTVLIKIFSMIPTYQVPVPVPR